MSGFKRVVDGLDKAIHRIAGVTHFIAIGILAFMMFLTTGDVTRRMISQPIYGSYELTGLGLSMLIFFSLGYTQLKKEHIAITFLVDRWSPRTQGIIDVLTHLVLSVLAATLTWQMFVHAARLKMGGDITLDLRLPVYVFAYVAAAGLVIFTLTQLLEFLKSILRVVEMGEQ